MSKKYISFFTGAMGLDIGLEQAGWECLAMNEFDKKIVPTIKANTPRTVKKIYDCDIRELSVKGLKKDLNIKEKELFAIVGGPPCQSFSTAGKRKGLSDSRGNVFLHFLDLATGLKPKYIVIENVRGLLSMPEENSDIQGGTLKKIIQILEKAGYSVNYNLYDTSYYGVPQKRERVIIIANRDKEKVPDIFPTHKDSEITLGKKPVISIKEALKNIISTEWTNFTPKRLKFFKMLKEGQNWKNLPSEEIKLEAMGNSYYSGGGKQAFLGV